MQLAAKFGQRRWRIFLLAGAVLFCAIVVGYYVATRPQPPTRAAAIQARLELAAGEVGLETDQATAPAISGTPLRSGARLKTGKGARARVRLPDGASLFLRDNTQLELQESGVSLGAGEYWLDAPPGEASQIRHQLGDVEVFAADSGLSLARSPAEVTVYVARGMATVTAPGGRVEVRAGERAIVKGKQAPAVAPVGFWDDWTGGMADFGSLASSGAAGSGVIYGVDAAMRSGERPFHLEITKQSVRAKIREGLSETEVDQTFFNSQERDLEGWYWFTVPERASVTGFAVETDGQLVWGEFIERKTAAQQYIAAKTSGHSPALLEWVDGHTYRARIYPIVAGRSRRVVLRYVELLTRRGETLEYVYPMAQRNPARIGEFSLTVDLGDDGQHMQLATRADARVERGGRSVSMRRSGFLPRADFQLEARLKKKKSAPLRLARYEVPGGESADYLMVRYLPDLEWSGSQAPRGDVVVVVDTSAGSDEATRKLQVATAQAILRALSTEDRFALISLDSKPKVLHPEMGLVAASDGEIEKALDRLAEQGSGGASDLSSLFEVALSRLHGAEQPAVVYVGDGLATTGELTHDKLIERLRRALSSSRARLFTVAVGNNADAALLGDLARTGGGRGFLVEDGDQASARALEFAAALKVPTITDLELDLGAGLDEPYSNALGKISRGEEVVVLARSHHDLPSKITVRGRLFGKTFSKDYEPEAEAALLGSHVPRLWAAEAMRRLLGSARGPDAERGRIAALGVEYGLMTPFTSLLALESENAYVEQGIPRRNSALRGQILGALEPDIGSSGASGRSAPAFMFGCSKSAPYSSEASPVAARKAEPAAASAPVVPEAAQDKSAEQESQSQAALRTSPGGGAAAPAEENQASLAPRDADDRAADPEFGIALGQRTASAPAPRSRAAAGNPRKPVADIAQPKAKPAPPQPTPRAAVALRRILNLRLGTCSDAAERPLPERMLLWNKRLLTAKDPEDLLSRYELAVRACEVPDWRAERALLELLSLRIRDEGTVTAVLSAFADRPDVQRYLAKLILRRAVDPRLIQAVERAVFGGRVDWLKVDLETAKIASAEQRLTTLRQYVAMAPDDPNGLLRLMRTLMDLSRTEEALGLGRRLRDQGFVTPLIAQQLGDMLARAGLADQAVRTYSEIVEFDAQNSASRSLLGDIYLAHGWYEPAYLEYRTLTEVEPENALPWLRLGSAAAGAGRVDEALRVARRVMNAQGSPGPTDPRRWARLLSAAWLSRLIAESKTDAALEGRRAAMQRELKELQLFSGPARVVLLSWQDYASELALVAGSGPSSGPTVTAQAGEARVGSPIEARAVGLAGLELAATDRRDLGFIAELRSPPRDSDLRITLHDIFWDGKSFEIRVSSHSLGARSTRLTL
ncbi:MAG TPA: VIT domain-containing protein [Polyangiaceae bacterium]|nr:VIT domain-containing protein [Polyangiaceae bacterium]